MGGAPGQTNGAPSAANPLPATRRLSLAQAKEIAFERNWDLLAAKSGIDSATAQLIVAKEFPNPTLSLSTTRIGTFDNATLEGNDLLHRSYDTIAAVSQLIEIGGKRRDRQVAARAGILGAKARFFDAKRSLDQGVTKAYVAALLAQANVRILNESTSYMSREADIAQARFKAGDISDADNKRIQISADQYALQAKSAAALAVQARIAVEVLMGEPQPRGQWTASDGIEQLAAARPPVQAAPPEAARPDVLAAEADLRGAEANLKLQKAYRIPDPTFTFLGEHNPSQPLPPPAADTLGIGVSFPLPLWNRNHGNILAARAAVDQYTLALNKLRTQVISDVATAEVAYQEASERLQRYDQQIQPHSAEVRESVSYAYRKGGASLVDLLEAERTDNDVRLATAQAMSDTASAAADLIAAHNVMTELAAGTTK